jgi:Tol biopolymer transport system component/tRNA A-37 threonylcarbamoyl transferase component Bud32
MAIAPGSRVGVYEVTSRLGEGAMGVVFRARDTKLLRDVALKVLPDHFANDSDRLSRLQREAQVLASLNHPNIAHVYGLEQVGGSECIAMEFVEGETLEERLKHGRLPVHDALEIATQLALGLAAAHERGIVHRDLKPANIKLASKGIVKILDFGLAKPFAGPAMGSDMSVMPTIASGSMSGGIFGTVAYMSPEQARGKDVDARTDIWAFGCVLYEMLTGQLAFGGETATDTIATIVTGQPDMAALPPDVPASIRLLISATLQKNAQQRLQHVGDARLFLDQAFVSPASSVSSVAAAPARPRRRAGMLAAAFAGGLAVALAAFALYLRPRPQPAAPAMRFELVLPNFVTAPSLSPDGQHIMYAGAAPSENVALWVRSIGAESVEKLSGTDKPTAAVWSPDGRAIAVVSDGKLKKIDLTTRSVQVICDVAEQPVGMTWGSSGVIMLSRKDELYRVPAEGGKLTLVMARDASRMETIHALPAFLPDGTHFVFAVGASDREKGGIFVGSLDGKTKSYLRPLGNRLNSLGYVSGYLLAGGDDLIAQPFDARTLTLSGSPVPIVDGLGNFWAASNGGVLVFQKTSTASPNKQLTWFDRAGKRLGELGAPAVYSNIEISPAGDRVAVDTIADNNRDVWVIDVARAVPSRLTFDPGSDWTPVWSPDGSQILFASNRTGTHMYQRPASGVGSDRLVFKSDSSEIPVSWSRDGRYIVFSRFKNSGAGSGVNTWLLTMAGEPKATPFIESPFDKAQARISPDGRWITYVTNDSGTYQVVVQSFPDPNTGRWQITAQGGIEPKWKHDGRELYYLAPDGKLMAVPVNPGPAFQAGSPSVLFQTPLVVTRGQTPRDRRYDVAPDGRFLIAVPTAAATQTPVTVVVNWTVLTNR